MLVEMERSYITAGFFRSTMHRRCNKIKEQEAMMAAGQKATSKGIGGAGGAGGASKGGKSFFPAFGGTKDPEPGPSAPSASEGSAPSPRQSVASEDDVAKTDGAGKGHQLAR